jgi:predicted permease
MGRPHQQIPLAQVNARLAAASSAITTATLPSDWPTSSQERYLAGALVAESAATGYSSLRNSYSDALYALMVVVGVVLLIACANVAHLLLARTAARQHEMALRLAIGAGRGRLIRQLLTESLLLALLGSAVGALFARWATGAIVGLISSRTNAIWLDLGLDFRVLGFAAAVATLTGLLFGLAPAWRAAHSPPQSALQAHGRSTAIRRRRFGITKGLVVGQVALSLVLLVAAGLLLRSFQKLDRIDPGFDPAGVLLVRLDVDKLGLPPAQRTAVYQDILERVRAVPGVLAASASLITPISRSGWNGSVDAAGFDPANSRDRLMWFNAVSAGYFATLGTTQLAGRDFGPEDVANGTPVAIVNASMARALFGDGNPIGQTFRTREGRDFGPPTEIVGVVQDARYRSLQDANVATAYLPISQTDLGNSRMNYEVRVAGNPMDLAPLITALAQEVSPVLSLEFTSMTEQIDASLARPRLLAVLSAFFGGLALLLATIGLYGTVAYSVARRQNEIGIRMALGARRSGVVGMILGEVSALLLAGVVLGLLIAVGVMRLLESFLYELTATDPATVTLAVGALVLAAVTAGTVPAWRAVRRDPMAALREE